MSVILAYCHDVPLDYIPKSNKKYEVNTAVKITQKFKNVSLKLTYFLKTKKVDISKAFDISTAILHRT